VTSQIICECGFVARGGAGEVVATIREHLESDHPDLAATVTPDVIRSWIEIVE
jgi:predicted small metal-binding protein